MVSCWGGDLPRGKLKLVQAWAEIHREDLMADWELAVQGLPPPTHQTPGVRTIMNRVLSVQALNECRLMVRMADGQSGVFDMRPYMGSPFFRELEDEAYFRRVGLFFDGIGWPNGQDIGPDTIAAELQALLEAVA
jgi:hypothetical protein